MSEQPLAPETLAEPPVIEEVTEATKETPTEPITEPVETPKATEEVPKTEDAKVQEVVKQEETAQEAPTEAHNAELDEKLGKLKQKLHSALLAANSVAEELKPLLPSDPEELETFLASEAYQTLKAKLDKPSLPPSPATEPAPKPPQKTQQESERDALARIGRAFVGA